MKMIILPNCKEAEEGIIAALFLYCEESIEQCKNLNPNLFYYEISKKVFISCLKTYDKYKTIDLTLCLELCNLGIIEQEYIMSAIDYHPSATTLPNYIKIITDKFIQREILKSIEKNQKNILANNFSFDEYHESQKTMSMLIDGHHSSFGDSKINMSNVYDTKRMLDEYQSHVDNMKNNSFTTGILNIDKLIRGVSGGEVMTIIARAGCFKTAWLQNMFKNYCRGSDNGAVFFSLEMPIASVTERYHSILSTTSGRDVEGMYIAKSSNEKIIKTHEETFIEALKNLYVVPVKCSLDDISKYIGLIEKTKKKKIGLIGIDYMGMIDGGDGKEYETVSKISRGVKQLAKQIGAPVILLCQTSRAGGDGKTEIELSHGRGSGAIEESADFLLGMWTEDDETIPETLSEYRRYPIIKILKNRKGPVGSRWKLSVRADTLQFGTHSDKYNPPVAKKRGYEG